MGNLMINYGGAIGDSIWSIPALIALRKHFDEIYLCCRKWGFAALGGTGLIDKFIVKPDEFRKWSEDYKRQWLEYQAQGMEWDVLVVLHHVIPGRLVFHPNSPRFKMGRSWKRAINRGRNHFDEITLWCSEILGINLSEALGQRPITRHTHKENVWLRDFRYMYNIPKSAFLLGWQFAGSARCKWYPYFQQVIQESIMQKYPEVYLIGLGDMDSLLEWDEECHHGRFVNLQSSISFRQAYVLTSILDLLVSPDTGIYSAAQAYEYTPKILLPSITSGKEITCGSESVILTPDCECHPCYEIGADCEIDPESNSPLCMANIKPRRLISAIEDVIERKRRMDTLRIKPLLQIGELREAVKV